MHWSVFSPCHHQLLPSLASGIPTLLPVFNPTSHSSFAGSSPYRCPLGCPVFLLWFSYSLHSLPRRSHSVLWLYISSPDPFLSLQFCLLNYLFGIFPWTSKGHRKLNMPDNKLLISTPKLLFPVFPKNGKFIVTVGQTKDLGVILDFSLPFTHQQILPPLTLTHGLKSTTSHTLPVFS